MKKGTLRISRVILLGVMGCAIAAFFVFDFGQMLTLEQLQARHAELLAFRAERPIVAAGLYYLAYVAVTGLSIPGATIMTLLGGAVFGAVWGTVLVSFASAMGSTLAFLAARFVFREFVQNAFGARLAIVNRGIAREGAFYLFAMRLVPLFPFFVVNLILGVTAMRTWTFYWVSQVGMLIGTIVFVNAGSQLASVETLSGLLSPRILASLTALAVFPLVARYLLVWLRSRRAVTADPL